MAEAKQYISEKSNFTIHRPPHFVQEKFQGDVVNTRIEPSPIEFTNGTYETADEDEQEAIENSGAFGKNLNEGDVAPHPTEDEFEEAEEQAADTGPTLQQQLEAADTPEEVQDILDAHGLPGLPVGTEAEPSDSGAHVHGDEPQEDAQPADESDLTPIEGVSKKGEALAALESTDLDVEVSKSNNVDEIVAFANQNGYRFVGWP